MTSQKDSFIVHKSTSSFTAVSLLCARGGGILVLRSLLCEGGTNPPVPTTNVETTKKDEKAGQCIVCWQDEQVRRIRQWAAKKNDENTRMSWRMTHDAYVRRSTNRCVRGGKIIHPKNAGVDFLAS